MGKKITAKNFTKDPYSKRVFEASSTLLAEKGYVAPVDLFLTIGLLSKADHLNWRNGKVPYLEKVIQCNLAKCSRIMRILAKHAERSNLKPSYTFYRKWGKGQKNKLRFTKYCEENVEIAYATHFVASKELREKLSAKAQRAAEAETKTPPQDDISAGKLLKKPTNLEQSPDPQAPTN